MTTRLNENERKVLNYLVGDGCDGHYYPFAPIIEHTQLDRQTVRRACRSLRRKGLTDFCFGLWTEDGETAGSGYGATEDGRHWYWNEGGGAINIHKCGE